MYLFTALCLLPFVRPDAAPQWVYGPLPMWDQVSGQTTNWAACNGAGSRQSPIAINSCKTDDALTPFVYTNFGAPSDSSVKYQASITAMKAHITVANGEAKLSGGGLPATYKIDFAHFHWGSHNERGSEHYMMGKSYPMEMHIVGYSDAYGNLGEAASVLDAVIVLGVVFKVGEPANPVIQAMLDTLGTLGNIADTPVDMDGFDMMQLLPASHQRYYRYDGSFTAPPCTEVAIWTMYEDPVTVTQAQMDALRALTSITDFKNDNYRHIMPLNGRVVKGSPGVECGAERVAAAAGVLLLSLLAIMIK